MTKTSVSISVVSEESNKNEQKMKQITENTKPFLNPIEQYLKHRQNRCESNNYGKIHSLLLTTVRKTLHHCTH